MKMKMLAAVLLATLAGAWAQAPRLTSIPLRDCQGLPCVDAVAGTRHLRLLVDSGDVATIIDSAAATGLSATPVAGAPAYQRALLKDLRLGTMAKGVDLGDVKVLVNDLAGLMKQNQMPRADGTLAYTAFADRLVEIDYARHQLRVSAPLIAPLACNGLCGKLELITFGKHGPPIVVGGGFVVNGHVVRAQIDTLFSGSLLVYPSAIASLGLSAAAQSHDKVFIPYTDGGVTMLRAKAASEGFAGKTLARNAALYFATPGVHLPDGLFEATVGAAFLAHHTLRLNFHDRWVAISG